MSHDSYTIDCMPGVALPSTAPSASAGSPLAAQSDATDKFRFSAHDNVYHSRAHFESTELDRLNSAHWQYATEAPVNDILDEQLPTMRTRSNHEAINNPTTEGLMLSHTLAVAGENGPLLDLWGENDAEDAWCAEAEQVFDEWFEHADASGQMSLAGLIKNWNIACWREGEFLEQIVNEERQFAGVTDVQMRLHGVEVQRLGTPYGESSNPNIVCGVKRNKYKRPVEYWISDDYNHITGGGHWYGASGIIHGYDVVQAQRGQARGIPWLQSGLPISADLRDYDLQVLDAARAAADTCIVASTNHPDSEYADNVPTSIEFRRRRINFMAPGWHLEQVTASHPTAQYKDHRQERMGDLGRAKGVPSMITRLDARDHNYSSARFDYQLLFESAKHVRSTLYNPILRRLALLAISESILAGKLRPAPRRFSMGWVWPNPPEIDEKKSADAEETYMRIGSLPYTTSCSQRHGKRARDMIRLRERDARMLAAAGLPSVSEATTKTGSPTSNQSSDTAA
ncbi:phage portal protein [Aureliella helgolandensis]|uniref:Phage portal protein, lambda family n=1 Tax=Aureliella helgolandensis TaxID=2527968 RepID=A0A518G2U8_9BACT|nr:phage portal protein [Aureliella helgolandensis]QDV22918.1 Phage portal protein, lambda family [Aureliella helgolandensis]